MQIPLPDDIVWLHSRFPQGPEQLAKKLTTISMKEKIAFGMKGRLSPLSSQRLTRATQRVLPLLRHPLTLLLVAFICNTLLWAAVTNIGHPPDEFSHFDYVCHLATNHALPIYGKTLNIHTPGLQTHASLPPLYYLLGTPFQMALSNRTITEQMLALRALSVLLGAITITLAYMFGRTLSPTRPPFAFAVATLVGFNPMFTYFCAAINSDNLINLIYAALLLLLAYGLRQQQPSRRWLIGLGALLGAGLITKQTIAMGVFVSALVIVYLAWKQRTRFLLTVTRYAFWTSSTALLISGWYFVRNWFLYGSPSGMFTGPRLDSYSAHPYQAAGSLWQMIFATRSEFAARSELTQFLPTVLRSFWGIFDHLEILMPQRLYNVMTWMLMGGLLGAAFWVARAYRHRHDSLTRYRLLVAGVGGLILILTFTGLLSLSYFIDYQPQGRYLFAALTPVSVAIVAGWEQLAKLLRARWLVAPLIVVLVLIVNVLALVCALAPAQHDRYLGQMMSYKSNASVRTVYDTSPAQASFVAQHSEIKRLEMLINSPPGVQGPLICRLGQQGTTDDLLAAVVQQPLAGPACYGIDVSSCRFTAGGTYTLKLEAPNITAQQPVLAALPTDDASGDQSAADLKLKIVYPGIFSRQTLSRADYLLRSDTPSSGRGRAQRRLYPLDALFLLVLAGVTLAPLIVTPWRLAIAILVLGLTLAVILPIPRPGDTFLPTYEISAARDPSPKLSIALTPRHRDFRDVADSNVINGWAWDANK